ncbi:MAG: chemotaxis protein CheW [Deltaproteobacteria bacterium HGW-Deltaproteobacteria-10]|nr:MAG: chemotaxis protein CheW [Deltaproteobacteria bacterium HGW-Deltaproteobacteria-10]
MNQEEYIPKTQVINDSNQRDEKYLTFSLDKEEYGIGILKVREIIGMMPVTNVPQTPSYFKGVINLRGKVIPVIDLRLKFGMESSEYTERTCIIVVEILEMTRKVLIGSVVDSVSEVLSIKSNEIEEAPNFGTSLDADYILGMAKVGNGLKILLDIDKVISVGESGILECAA